MEVKLVGVVQIAEGHLASGTSLLAWPFLRLFGTEEQPSEDVLCIHSPFELLSAPSAKNVSFFKFFYGVNAVAVLNFVEGIFSNHFKIHEFEQQCHLFKIVAWKALKEGNTTQFKSKSPTTSLLLREWDQLKLQQDVIYRVTVPPGQNHRSQLVLPIKFRKIVLKALHDSCHLGIDKTYGLIKERVYWPNMKSVVEEHCKNCARCIKKKTLPKRVTPLFPKRVAPLFHMQSDGQLDLVCMDFLFTEPDSSNTDYVLVMSWISAPFINQFEFTIL